MNEGAFYVVGIDPGSKTSGTGLAVLHYPSRSGLPHIVQAHLFRAPMMATSLALDGKHRWNNEVTWRHYHIIRNLVDYLAAMQLDFALIACEEPYLMGRANAHMNRFFGGLELALFDRFRAPLAYVDPSTAKKHIGGSGKADKEGVRAGVCERLKISQSKWFRDIMGNESDDLTDAIAVALTATDVCI